ncbi:hypothetical protein Lsan_1424 [Legionella santicrucis]|uniref:Uncharacterized protein n=1 Tax=Legionella santicrucis TaxID=45074 RepID=A0A0W0Z2E8_9GAMM|nr:hypothetical protein Lsan_1424 [Legionella santicrucis]
MLAVRKGAMHKKIDLIFPYYPEIISFLMVMITTLTALLRLISIEQEHAAL